MKYLSVCSGIEAATVAWDPLGWAAVGFSEIEKFPNSVLAHHYPTIENYGDMNGYQEWPRTDIDVLVGGTPCQSFSVAGLRAGMADPRGNLALIYLAIAQRYGPDWLVWENVPGVLSSDGGRDFAAIIGGMVKLGYGIAYRVLDAQYFGVPQRRRRVFVVASARDWRDSAKVLFEPACLRRNPPPSREKGESVAGTFGGCSDSGGFRTTDLDNNGAFIPETVGAICADSHPGSYTGQDAYTGRVFSVAAPLTAGSSSKGINPPGRRQEDDHNLVAFAQNQRDEVRQMAVAGALAAEPGAKQQKYVFKPSHYTRGKDGAPGDVCPPLSADADKGDQDPVLQQDMAVRRLTPLECERLQGFPDGYTDIPGASDSRRYRALGNSMAVPVMSWIGERIAAAHGR